MKTQTRDSVLRTIKSYLKKNPSETKGVRSFDKNRVEALIKRLDEYSPIETINWNLPDRKLFREIALAAGIQFVRQYPMLYHTPNSLRACFGMPTRTDRKKGITRAPRCHSEHTVPSESIFDQSYNIGDATQIPDNIPST